MALGSVDKPEQYEAFLVGKLQQSACPTATENAWQSEGEEEALGGATSRQPGDKRRGANEAGYGHRGQGAPGGSVVNAASDHVEIGKKSLATAP